MMEDVELRHLAIRRQLNDLQYFQPLSAESAALAEKLLSDLVTSVESFHQVKNDLAEEKKATAEAQRNYEGLLRENPRLVAENNELHALLLAESDRLEQEHLAARRKVQSMEDELDQARFMAQEMTARAKSAERRAEQINERNARLLQHPVDEPAA